MEEYIQREYERVETEIISQLEKMKRDLPAAQKDIEFLDLLFRKLNSTREDERSLQIKATSSSTEVCSSNEKVPPEPAALEPSVQKPTQKEQLQKRKRSSALVDGKASADSTDASVPKKKSKVKETARNSAQAPTKTKPTKTLPKNVSNEKRAKIVSVEPGNMSMYFLVKEANDVINKYRGFNIRTSKREKDHEPNTLKVCCNAIACKGSHILRVLDPSAMIRSYTDQKQLERQSLDAKKTRTADPGNYEILSIFFQKHTCTNKIYAPIVINDDDEESQADQSKRRDFFKIFIKRETEE